MRNHPFFTGQEVAVKQAEVKAVSKAKADVLAKAWSQTQALKERDPVVCALDRFTKGLLSSFDWRRSFLMEAYIALDIPQKNFAQMSLLP